jgi:hypothetical protein
LEIVLDLQVFIFLQKLNILFISMEHNNLDLLSLPNDLIKDIISYYPCLQWFILCKRLKNLANDVISPLDHRSLVWAITNNKIIAAVYLLKDSRIDPCVEGNAPIRYAAYYGYKEIVKILLEDTRVDPAADDNQAIIWAAQRGHTEVVELLLQGNLKLY